jgi:hypothetical protein
MDVTLVDSRFVKRKVWGGENPGSFEIWEYMVDVPGPGDAAAVRLTFTEKTFKVRGEPKPGSLVPVLVNPKRTKVMFDLSDPRIDQAAWVDEQAGQRKQRDDERFEALRAGRETVTSSLWSVQATIGAAGLPAVEWAAAANALLRADASVRPSDVSAASDSRGLALEDGPLVALSVRVLVDAPDAVSATELVELSVAQALFDVAGSREPAWTADDWTTVPAGVDAARRAAVRALRGALRRSVLGPRGPAATGLLKDGHRRLRESRECPSAALSTSKLCTEPVIPGRNARSPSRCGEMLRPLPAGRVAGTHRVRALTAR